jgi:hypothetical protein
MIIERRKRIRISKPDEIDWVADYHTGELGDWGDMPVSEQEVTPWQIVLYFAILAWFAAYMIGSIIY